MKGKFHLATVRPTIDRVGNVAYASEDILFDWYPFEIPRGGCKITTMQVIMPGTNGADGNVLDMDLLFAKSINGVAPTSIGTENAAVTKIGMTSSKNNLIGHKFLDGDRMSNSVDFLGYNIWNTTTGATMDYNRLDIVLEGDPNYAGTTAGYQTIWIAAIAQGAFDFGTNCLLDGAVTDLSTRTFDVSEDADADDIFDVGDELIAFASDGSSGQIIGNITSLTADTITTDGVGFDDALADDDEICFRSPMIFHLGLEY
jgi:hypothetical protein